MSKCDNQLGRSSKPSKTLVAYSDSESETENDSQSQVLADTRVEDPSCTRKRKHVDEGIDTHTLKLPPKLPTSFFSLYATNARTSTSDDPNIHGGRTRQVPHIEGNWPTHVYLEWNPSKDEVQLLESVVSEIEAHYGSLLSFPHKQINSLLRSDLNVQLPLHISLSAPLVLQTDQRDRFLEALTDLLRNTNTQSFTTRSIGLDWVHNFDKTRFFLVLRLEQTIGDELNKLLKACNLCAAKLGLPTLNDARDNPTLTKTKQIDKNSSMTDQFYNFHVSIAWTLSDISATDKQWCRDHGADQVKDIRIRCDVLKVKIGNTVHDIQLDVQSQSVGRFLTDEDTKK